MWIFFYCLIFNNMLFKLYNVNDTNCIVHNICNDMIRNWILKICLILEHINNNLIIEVFKWPSKRLTSNILQKKYLQNHSIKLYNYKIVLIYVHSQVTIMMINKIIVFMIYLKYIYISHTQSFVTDFTFIFPNTVLD